MTPKKFVLVIDDDSDVRDLLSALLENAGFAVDTLDDGIAALKLPKHYDAILLDLNMPVFDGEQLTAYWMMTDPDVLRRVIVVTGYAEYARRRSLPKTFGSLTKPIHYGDLIRLVDECARQEGGESAECRMPSAE
jgi:CheY-like chemotaxis protein